MTLVALSASLPSVRLGLAAMLADRGHVVAAELDDAPVWVLDAPSLALIESLPERAEGDVHRGWVVLTDDATLAAQLTRLGLRGWACLGRDVGPDELDLAVRAVEAGLVLLDVPLASAALNPPPAAGPRSEADSLSPRELQVLALLAQGLPNKSIAQALSITEHTVKFHVGSLSAKLGAASRTEAVALAARRGLIVL